MGGEYVEFNHPDRLGTRLQTNQAGGTAYEQSTLPFGTALNAESSLTTNNKRFTSYDRSSATGLDYAINRTYDSKQGRFTQVDPIGMRSVSISDPQTLNLYAYCANDPINYVDPSGLGFLSFVKKFFKWVMIAIAVAVAVVSIVGILAAPLTLAGILGLVSAATGAASAVLGGLGYHRAAKMFGLIAAVTGMGSLILAKTGISTFSESGPINSVKSAANIGIATGVGAIVNSLNARSEESGNWILKQLKKIFAEVKYFATQCYELIVKVVEVIGNCLETLNPGCLMATAEAVRPTSDCLNRYGYAKAAKATEYLADILEGSYDAAVPPDLPLPQGAGGGAAIPGGGKLPPSKPKKQIGKRGRSMERGGRTGKTGRIPAKRKEPRQLPSPKR